MVSSLVSTAWLAEHLTDLRVVIVDVRWMVIHPDAGRIAFLENRIPGAIFLSLDTDLSDRTDLRKGRHPLPDPDRFLEVLQRKGIGKDSHIVAYDSANGSIAARLWWMMQWIGSPICSVLDGGVDRWLAEGRPMESGPVHVRNRAAQRLPLNLHPELIVEKAEIEAFIGRGGKLLDARAPERYRGEVEPIDSQAGHIPGAINAPFQNNLTQESVPVYRNIDELRTLYMNIGLTEQSEVVCSCGSGVTACHDILALNLAGFRNVKLYPGSWSGWIAETE